MMPGNQKSAYDLRLCTFLDDIARIGRMTPREKYLHPLMDSVPFKDLETAILMTGMEHEKSRKKRAVKR